MKVQLAKKNAKFYIINATEIANKCGMRGKTNTTLQSAFFALNEQIMPYDKAVELMKAAAKKSYGKKIILDFNKTRWLEANLSAIFGAILSFGLVNNKIQINRVSKSISRILIKNKFLKSYGFGENLYDTY